MPVFLVKPFLPLLQRGDDHSFDLPSPAGVIALCSLITLCDNCFIFAPSLAEPGEQRQDYTQASAA